MEKGEIDRKGRGEKQTNGGRGARGESTKQANASRASLPDTRHL